MATLGAKPRQVTSGFGSRQTPRQIVWKWGIDKVNVDTSDLPYCRGIPPGSRKSNKTAHVTFGRSEKPRVTPTQLKTHAFNTHCISLSMTQSFNGKYRGCIQLLAGRTRYPYHHFVVHVRNFDSQNSTSLMIYHLCGDVRRYQNALEWGRKEESLAVYDSVSDRERLGNAGKVHSGDEVGSATSYGTYVLRWGQ